MNQRGVFLSDDFGPLLPGPAFGGLALVTKVLFTLGCFQQEDTYPKCNNACKLKTDTGWRNRMTEVEWRTPKCHFVAPTWNARPAFISSTGQSGPSSRTRSFSVRGQRISQPVLDSVHRERHRLQSQDSREAFEDNQNSLFPEKNLRREKCFLAGMGRESKSLNHVSFQESTVLVGWWKHQGMGGCSASLKISLVDSSTFKWCEQKTRQHSNKSSKTSFEKNHNFRRLLAFSQRPWKWERQQTFRVNHSEHCWSATTTNGRRGRTRSNPNGRSSIHWGGRWGRGRNSNCDWQERNSPQTKNWKILAWSQTGTCLSAPRRSEKEHRNCHVSYQPFEGVCSFQWAKKVVIRAMAKHQTQVDELMRYRDSIYDDDQIETPAVWINWLRVDGLSCGFEHHWNVVFQLKECWKSNW